MQILSLEVITKRNRQLFFTSLRAEHKEMRLHVRDGDLGHWEKNLLIMRIG